MDVKSKALASPFPHSVSKSLVSVFSLVCPFSSSRGHGPWVEVRVPSSAPYSHLPSRPCEMKARGPVLTLCGHIPQCGIHG